MFKSIQIGTPEAEAAKVVGNQKEIPDGISTDVNLRIVLQEGNGEEVESPERHCRANHSYKLQRRLPKAYCSFTIFPPSGLH